MDRSMQALALENESESDSESYTDEDTVQESYSDKLDITEQLAKANLLAAGMEVPEESDKISLAANKGLLDTDVNSCLDGIVNELSLPYELAEFQRVSINALAQLKNVILISPTGSGKMNVPLLATLVLRARSGNPKGIEL